MSRLSAILLTDKPEDAPICKTFGDAAKRAVMSFEVLSCRSEEIAEHTGNWVILPELIIIDKFSDVDHRQILEIFESESPGGETEVIFSGVPNDITIYRKLKKEGISEIFDDDPDPEDVFGAFYDVISRLGGRSEIEARRAIYVWSAAGGAGGSSIAQSISNHYARSGLRTLHIDMDLSIAPASIKFGMEKEAPETPGLIEALSNPSRIDSLFLQRSVQSVDRNLFYLSCRKKEEDTDLKPEALSILIARAQKGFDMVVIDTPWRSTPEPDWHQVLGISYIVSNPSPNGLLGFFIVTKNLHAIDQSAEIYGVLSKKGEFGRRDIDIGRFQDEFSNDIIPVPFDPDSASKLFYNRGTFATVGGKLTKAFDRIVATLPDPRITETSKKKKRGLF